MTDPIIAPGGVVLEMQFPGFAEVEVEPLPANIMYIPVPGPQGTGGGGGGGNAGQLIITGVSGSALSSERAVTQNSSGNIVYATNTNLAHANVPIWLNTSAVSAAILDVSLLVVGEWNDPTWGLTAGPIWLGANGVLTQTPPVLPAIFSRLLGYALSSTEIFFSPQLSIILG